MFPAPLLFVESSGHEETNCKGQGYFNRPEGLKMISILKGLIKSGLDADDVGVVRIISY